MTEPAPDNDGISPFPATPQQITLWLPQGFDEVLGNQMMVRHFQNVLQSGGCSPPTLVIGPPRTGKTATIKVFFRILLCENTEPTSIRPCGTCKHCLNKTLARDGLKGIDVSLRSDAKFQDKHVHVVPVDCSEQTESSIKKLLDDELKDYNGLRIVYLDEVHRLAKRGIDELFLLPMTERNFTWIASSTTSKGLEPAFLNRFPVRLSPEPPSLDAMSTWLARRCVEWMLDWDVPETLVLLSEASCKVPGIALHVLTWAAGNPDRTVHKWMVDQHAATLPK